MVVDIDLAPIYHEVNGKVKHEDKNDVMVAFPEEITEHKKRSEGILKGVNVTAWMKDVTFVLVFILRLPAPIHDKVFQL